MRRISNNFVNMLKKNGLFYPIVIEVIKDQSLDLEIRGKYINIYFKGNAILKLWEDGKYEINPKFLSGTNLDKYPNSYLKTKKAIDNYINDIPLIKKNVITVKKTHPTLEIEYEQLLIRSNNLNKNVNSPIYITDRQYMNKATNTRFDLTGFFIKENLRKQKQILPLTFIEVKYSLNQDIKDIKTQILKYYATVKKDIKKIAQETEYLKNIKIELELINQKKSRLDAIKKLKISDKIEDAIFIIALLDYNPNSSKIISAINELKKLPFNQQIRIFYGGFAIWKDYLKNI